MLTIFLVIDVILAVILVALVLVQRSDGALGSIGGGASSIMSTRSKGNFLTKSTAIVAALFMACSLVLCIISKPKTENTVSVLNDTVTPQQEEAVPTVPLSGEEDIKGALSPSSDKATKGPVNSTESVEKSVSTNDKGVASDTADKDEKAASTKTVDEAANSNHVVSDKATAQTTTPKQTGNTAAKQSSNNTSSAANNKKGTSAPKTDNKELTPSK